MSILSPHSSLVNRARLWLKTTTTTKRLTDKLGWFFRLGCLADISLNTNEESLLLQGKQMMRFVANDKI